MQAIYVPPIVKKIRVVMEDSIANTVRISAEVYIQNDWIEELTPLGEDPAVDGGNVYFFWD